MRILFLKPLRSGYNITLGNDIGITNVVSGMPRRRRMQDGASHRVAVSYKLKAYEYDYLMAFWRLTRAEPFVARLIMDSSKLRWYECRWVGAPLIKNHGAGVFSFTCEVATGRYVKMTRAKRASHPYPLDHTEQYHVNAQPLDAVMNVAVWSRTVSDGMLTVATPLDATMNTAIAYATVIDGMTTAATPLDAELNDIFTRLRPADTMLSFAKPLDAVMVEPIKIRRASELLAVAATPMDAVFVQAAWPRYNDEDIVVTAKPLNAVLTDLAVPYTHPSEDNLVVSAKPLDAELY